MISPRTKSRTPEPSRAFIATGNAFISGHLPRRTSRSRSHRPRQVGAAAADRAHDQVSTGSVAPRSACTSIPGEPSAFITTTVHEPLAGSHDRVLGPGPLVEATQ